MTRLWWNQIRSVIRLEMKKTFFARRGLWIYLLALLPLLLFTGHSIQSSRQQARRQRLVSQGEKKLMYRDLLAVRSDMTSEEVIALLGRPPSRFHWNEQTPSGNDSFVVVPHESYHYSDGSGDLYVELANGKVTSVEVRDGYNRGEDSVIFAGVFQFFYLRLAVFFGCLGIFMNLFRGEILDKSLHFYFLAPIRREVLMVGKFLAGLLATCVIFVASELLQIILFISSFTPNAQDLYLFHYHGIGNSVAYLGITALACLGYGAFFLAAGMLFRNPILPAAGILIWEALNPFLPALLQKFSVIYYLKALCPVDIPVPPGTPPVFALLVSNSDPVSPPVAILGVVLMAGLVLYVSTLQVRRMEINYTTE